MADYVKVTEQSWGSRLKSSISGFFFGIVLVVVGVGLLFWNEGRTVKRAKSLDEGASAVISVDAFELDGANEGRLVHFSAEAVTDETLSDPLFGQSYPVLKLHRKVEMYQWREKSESEKKKKVGGGTRTETTYSYSKEWSSSAMDSDDFERPQGHENPPWELSGQSWEARSIVAGAYELSKAFTDDINRSTPVTLTEDDLAMIPGSLRDRLRLFGDTFYLGSDPSSPAIGDLRVSFSVVMPTDVTVIGQQQGSQVTPYRTRAGGSLAMLDYGTVPAEQMFEAAQSANTFLSWVLRVVGFVVIFFGFATILKPLSVFADVVPLVGNLVAKGIGFVSFMLAAPVALSTIAVGWIFYRPLLGITLFAAAAGLVVWLFMRGRGKPAAAPPVPPPPPPPPPPA